MTDDPKNIAPENMAPDVPQEPASAASTVSASQDLSPELAKLTDDVIAALKTVFDPEIPADIYELGLIYRIDIGDDRAVTLDMTLTTPNCPAAQDLPQQVENAVSSVPGVGPVKVNVVWTPPWDPSRMSDEARVVLNMW